MIPKNQTHTSMKFRSILPVLFVLSCSFGSFTSCKEPSTGPDNKDTDSLVLKLKETDLTSATLNLHTAGLILPAQFSLLRNGDTVQTFSLYQSDTLFKDPFLIPSTRYTWQVLMSKTNQKSNEVTGRTQDTTSHIFSWRLDTLGSAGSNLFDVVIVNDTCIWVAGDITTRPYSSFERYNAAMWNGKGWKKFRFVFPNYTGSESVQIIRTLVLTGEQKLYFISEIGSVVATDITGEIEYFRTLVPETKGVPSESWGTGIGDFYFSGMNGSLTSYNGSSFSLMPSNTDVDLMDIFSSGNGVLWSTGNDLKKSVLLKYQVGSWFIFREFTRGPGMSGVLPVDDLRLAYSSVWQQKGSDSIWVTTSWGVHKQSVKPDGKARWVYQRRWDKPETNPVGFPSRIRGTDENNVWVSGQHGAVLHFNGWSWHRYTQFYNLNFWFLSLDVKVSKAVLVGEDLAGSAIILMFNP
ncbi:MAG: hypothetical protein LCH54_18045 [Bacteroidetes bacterium]|nr:hypothetical protein [Bacteroidota bacterium]